MANDSLADETRAHQPFRKNNGEYRSDLLLASTQTPFVLFFTHIEINRLKHLLAIGNRLSRQINSAEAHLWEELSEQFAVFIEKAKKRTTQKGGTGADHEPLG